MLNDSIGRYIEVGGLRTFYVMQGSGTPILRIHGGAPGACSLINWHCNIGPLAQAGFSVYALDQPGFGYTNTPADASLEYRVQHAHAFVNLLALKRFHIIGNSQGAYIAARLALEHPGVDRLVLVSSSTLAPHGSNESASRAQRHSNDLRSFQPSLENTRTMTLKTIFRSELVTDELVKARYEMSAGKHHEAAKLRRAAQPPAPLLGRLGEISAPTLIFWGADDHGVALERSLLLMRAMPNAELHIFPKCAHWVQWDHAARFNQMVSEFLA